MRLSMFAVTFLTAVLTGCVQDQNDPSTVVERNQVEMRGERVLLTADQMRCGERKGLWGIELLDGARPTGKMSSRGRALGFEDDVFVGSKKISGPYAQIRGPFTLKAKRIESVLEENSDVKVVSGKFEVVISHECFVDPLPLAGVDGGEFSELAPAKIRLRQHDGWTVDGFVH